VTPYAHARIGSVELLAAVAFVTVVAWPRWRRMRDDSMSALQAVVLRVEDYDGTRTLRSPAPITIGRASNATLVIADAQVSRMHARIDLSDGILTIFDLGSRNGTLVNARPIDGSAPLVIGDEIDIGTTRVVYTGVGAWT